MMRRVFIVLMVATVALTSPACGTKKKIAEREALAKQEKITDAKKRLNALLTDDGRSLDDKESELKKIKDMKLDDAEVNELIAKVENYLTEQRRLKEIKDEEIRKQKEAEENRKKQLGETGKTLTKYFKAIAEAPTVDDANKQIDSALQLFDSEQVPVLIIISKSGNQKDYDRPTTIRRFLELIKDQKKYISNFENISFNGQGKITELELIK